jgi:hypothetical protein
MARSRTAVRGYEVSSWFKNGLDGHRGRYGRKKPPRRDSDYDEPYSKWADRNRAMGQNRRHSAPGHPAKSTSAHSVLPSEFRNGSLPIVLSPASSLVLPPPTGHASSSGTDHAAIGGNVVWHRLDFCDQLAHDRVDSNGTSAGRSGCGRA